MYGECNISIERTQNGFMVRITDPEIAKRNRERDTSESSAPWQDPQVKYSFEDKQGVIDFITKSIDKALPVDEYSSTFDKAAKDLK